LQLADSTMVSAKAVVVAIGLENAAHIPPELSGLPPALLSHSSAHQDLSSFRGKEVLVVGGGQSALESAALLAEHGSCVSLLVRDASLAWNSVPNTAPRSRFERVRYPLSGLGIGLELWAYCTAPGLFRHLPQGIRHRKLRTVLGPAGAWWLKDRVVGRLRLLMSHAIWGAGERGGRATLQVGAPDGRFLSFKADHVIAATGYRFDLQRIPFLHPNMLSQLRSEQGMPVLSGNFESSVPGLYFTGLASANSFGPAMRFLYGTHFTGRRLSRHLCRGRALARSDAGPPIREFIPLR